jgi:hypothetical protein
MTVTSRLAIALCALSLVVTAIPLSLGVRPVFVLGGLWFSWWIIAESLSQRYRLYARPMSEVWKAAKAGRLRLSPMARKISFGADLFLVSAVILAFFRTNN